ncbi:MAG: CXXX repeat peptide maturase [Bacteroidales bacterium]|nr:CXXX repeat peptide maturase [Bacteroidales bacterium]MCM1147970.1 CXXX repeat peptide maturase [Bacteroidales bacterium]MCM1206894.1 CXXX repeat peptide maturase [Bacillota bacterium]MCM1509527.1 CXXX repeat peptide maturase [Clostridium sp.]
MLKYLIILLDDTSVSYCHYGNMKTERRLMPPETLRAGILFGMKENLNIQFVYPEYELPHEYKEIIDSIDHTDIKPVSAKGKTDVAVADGTAMLAKAEIMQDTSYVLRTDKTDLFASVPAVCGIMERTDRLNIVVTDIETFTEEDFRNYRMVLKDLSEKLAELYVAGKSPQLNLLTDRMMLSEMNNCGAGDTSIALAPDGRFYVCPAFYHMEEGMSAGDPEHGPDIRNPQLYRIGHAPLCRNCDAYQCRRCVWLNRKMTYEVNTPSHEQCVAAHLERNASRELLEEIRKHGTFLPDSEIKEISYLDPFDIKEE